MAKARLEKKDVQEAEQIHGIESLGKLQTQQARRCLTHINGTVFSAQNLVCKVKKTPDADLQTELVKLLCFVTGQSAGTTLGGALRTWPGLLKFCLNSSKTMLRAPRQNMLVLPVGYVESGIAAVEYDPAVKHLFVYLNHVDVPGQTVKIDESPGDVRQPAGLQDSSRFWVDINWCETGAKIRTDCDPEWELLLVLVFPGLTSQSSSPTSKASASGCRSRCAQPLEDGSLLASGKDYTSHSIDAANTKVMAPDKLAPALMPVGEENTVDTHGESDQLVPMTKPAGVENADHTAEVPKPPVLSDMPGSALTPEIADTGDAVPAPSKRMIYIHVEPRRGGFRGWGMGSLIRVVCDSDGPVVES